jgi:glucokinase
MTTYVAVDVGGTNIRAACLTSDGEWIARAQRPTPDHADDDAVFGQLYQTVAEVLPGSVDGVKAIGVCAPGPVDPFAGVIYRAPNVPGWVNVPLRDKISAHFSLPTVIGNDANMAVLGEWKFGAGRGHQDVLFLTISTGIGGGVVSGGRLVVGARGLATELGHITLVPGGPLCGCGHRGHLEALASGTAIAHAAQVRLQTGARSTIREAVSGDIRGVTARHVGLAAQAGDAFALGLLREAGTYIGYAVADFLHMFNPALVILGGGVALNTRELLFDPIHSAMRERLIDPAYTCPIVPAQLGDDVGLLGTLALLNETYPDGR